MEQRTPKFWLRITELQHIPKSRHLFLNLFRGRFYQMCAGSNPPFSVYVPQSLL